VSSRRPPDDRRKPRERFGTARLFALVLAIAATIAGAEFYALKAKHQSARSTFPRAKP